MKGRRLSLMCPSIVTYAVPASNVDGQICVIVPSSGVPLMFAVTSTQLPPPLRVYQTLPSFVPAHSRPRSFGDDASAYTVAPANCPRLSCTTPPEATIRRGSFVERSWLICTQVCPSLDVFQITSQA